MVRCEIVGGPGSRDDFDLAGGEQVSGNGEITHRFITAGEILKLPSPSWLIRELIPERSLTMLFGEPGVGKSLLALDIAMSIASCESWQGRETKEGSVLYLSAEGNDRMSRRIQAWCKAHGKDADDLNLTFHDSFMSISSEHHVNSLCEAIRNHQSLSNLRLVVVDTLARYAFGLDENDAGQTGLFVHGLEKIRRLGVAVLAIHHTTKDGRDYRGSSALEGAMDTMIRLIGKSTSNLRLSVTKQKDYAKAPELLISTTEISIADDETSLVVAPKHLPDQHRADIKVLMDIFQSGEWISRKSLLSDHKDQLMKVKIGSRNSLRAVIDEMFESGVLEAETRRSGERYFRLFSAGHADDDKH
jgi:hypothetical protein